MDIRFLDHEEINKERWDEVIKKSPNGFIYATSKYLDIMSPGWHALISDDYEFLMPLPVKRQFGFKRINQPVFCQQLGIISEKNSDEKIVNDFLSKASSMSDEIDIYLNYKNQYKGAKLRTNLVLPLNQSFSEIQSHFRKDIIANAIKQGIIYTPADIAEVFSAYKKLIFPKNKHLKKAELEKFRRLCELLNKDQQVITRKVISEKGKMLSSALFFKDEKRIYYMMSATEVEGRNNDANAYLLHEMIREESETQRTFDFEGSVIPGVRFFFEKFSPEDQPYPHFQLTKLKGWQKSLKNIYKTLKGNN